MTRFEKMFQHTRKHLM